MHSHNFERSSTSEFQLASNSSKMPSTTKSQDINVKSVEVQENPSYAPSTSDTNTSQGEYDYICTSDLM